MRNAKPKLRIFNQPCVDFDYLSPSLIANFLPVLHLIFSKTNIGFSTQNIKYFYT